MINAFGRLSAWFGALSVSDKIALIGVGAVVIGIRVAILAWLDSRKPRGKSTDISNAPSNPICVHACWKKFRKSESG